MFRFGRLLAVLVLLGAASLFGAGSASATALDIGQCTTSSGVILAVDFSHWGGGVYRSCGSTPTTGMTLLQQGGWTEAGTSRYPYTFVCRIGYAGFGGGTQYPTPADDPCVNTPKATAYWSYWHAGPSDSTWSYSASGAATYAPKPGSVDAWVFGSTNVAGTSGGPSFSPDSVRAHNTSPTGGPVTVTTPAAPPASTPAGGTGSGGSGAGGSSSGGSGGGGGGSSSVNAPVHSDESGPAASRSASASRIAASSAAASKAKAKASASAAAKSASASGPSSSVSSAPPILNAEPTADVKHSSGSFVPELVAAVILVVLGGFTGIRYWRRKQVSQQS